MRAIQDMTQLSIFTCDLCGQPLPKGRCDMRYHDQCRKKSHAIRKRCERTIKRTVVLIGVCGDIAAFHGTRECGIEGLQALSAAIQNAYAIANVRRVK